MAAAHLIVGSLLQRRRQDLVIEMTRSAYALLGSEYDSFLFAPIGEERNGMLLSVVSALARLGIDPWQEAAKLTLLPEEAARERLASLITPLSDELSIDRDALTIAARLAALLPRSADSKVLSHTASSGVGPRVNSRALFSMFVINTIFVVMMLGALSIMANHQPSAQADKDQARISNTVPPQMKSSNVNK